MVYVDKNEFKKRIADFLMVSEDSIQDETNFFYDLEIVIYLIIGMVFADNKIPDTFKVTGIVLCPCFPHLKY